jgi:predicted RNA binding protein YcfA (HicA-like mRNA interferase family)
MPEKNRELKKRLRDAGFTERPAKGSHVYFEHPLLPRVKFSYAGADGDDAKDYQIKRVRDLLKQVEEARRNMQ